eukprot:1649522-Rhodomonas_salina.1
MTGDDDHQSHRADARSRTVPVCASLRCTGNRATSGAYYHRTMAPQEHRGCTSARCGWGCG